MEEKDSLPCLQKPSTGSYSVINEQIWYDIRFRECHCSCRKCFWNCTMFNIILHSDIKWAYTTTRWVVSLLILHTVTFKENNSESSVDVSVILNDVLSYEVWCEIMCLYSGQWV
jgi:hypothetical protein